MRISRQKHDTSTIRFKSEDDWFDYRLEDDPRFLQRIEKARKTLRAERGIRLEDVNFKE